LHSRNCIFLVTEAINKALFRGKFLNCKLYFPNTQNCHSNLYFLRKTDFLCILISRLSFKCIFRSILISRFFFTRNYEIFMPQNFHAIKYHNGKLFFISLINDLAIKKSSIFTMSSRFIARLISHHFIL